MVMGGRELMVGVSRDDQFGPCVVYGLGGVFAEILRDTTFRVAPVDRQEALDMINDIRARGMLTPFRGMEAANLDQLADILIRVAAIGLDHEEIKEIDINPLMLSHATFLAVDALIVLSCARQP
jgi:acetyl-CoA synthetase (ADP-forming)